MDVYLGIVKGFYVESQLPTRIVWIVNRTDGLTIDIEKGGRAPGIHAQRVGALQAQQRFAFTFQQHFQSIRCAFEHAPGPGAG